MHEAQDARSRHMRPDPELPSVVVRLLAVVKDVPGGAGALFQRMDTDRSEVVDSDKLSAGLGGLSLATPFTAADVDEIIGFVSMSDEDSFGALEWQEFIAASSGQGGSRVSALAICRKRFLSGTVADGEISCADRSGWSR